MQFFKKNTENPSYEVEDGDLFSFKKMVLVSQKGDLTLYKDKGAYYAVLKSPGQTFQIFKSVMESEAKELFSTLASHLNGLLSDLEEPDISLLQKLLDVTRHHKGYSVAHFAAAVGLVSLLNKDSVKEHIKDAEIETGKLPIHVALEKGNLEFVSKLISLGENASFTDNENNNGFHYAARSPEAGVIKILSPKDKNLVNALNSKGMTPLQVACQEGKDKNVLELLRLKADPSLTGSQLLAVHYALEADSPKCLEILLSNDSNLIKFKDVDGNSLMHLIHGKHVISTLLNKGLDLERRNNNNETPLIRKINEKSYSAIIGLIYKGSDINQKDPEGHSLLQKANISDSYLLAKLLLAFGCDANEVDNEELSIRHKTSTEGGKNKDYILYYLNAFGAQRCKIGTAGCNSGCAAKGGYNGKLPGKEEDEMEKDEENKDWLTVFVEDATAKYFVTGEDKFFGIIKKKFSIWDRLADQQWNDEEDEEEENVEETSKKVACDRILTIDSGCLEAIASILTLSHLEKISQRDIKSQFDWIAGTGCGAFVALSMLRDVSLKTIFNSLLELYFEVLTENSKNKDGVDKFFKQFFGEKLKMNELKYPKVVATCANFNKKPFKIDIYRNYDYPEDTVKDKEFDSKASGQPVWMIAKNSGTGTSSSYDTNIKSIDTSLLSNNPTLDVLQEICDYYTAVAISTETYELKDIQVLVSLGIKLPEWKGEEGEKGVWQVAKDEDTIADYLIGKTSLRNQRTTNLTRAWCSMMGSPFMRIEPTVRHTLPPPSSSSSPPTSSSSSSSSFLASFRSEDNDDYNEDDKFIINLICDCEFYLRRIKKQFAQLTMKLLR